jgi:hypothetical protein
MRTLRSFVKLATGIIRTLSSLPVSWENGRVMPSYHSVPVRILIVIIHEVMDLPLIFRASRVYWQKVVIFVIYAGILEN